jgi:hypothetical protein
VGNEIYAALDPDPGNPQVLQVDLKVGKKTDADASCAVLQTRRSPSDLSGQWQGFAVHAMSNVSPTWIYQVGIREGRPGIFRWVFGTLGTNSEALYWPEGGPPGEGAPPRFQGIALAKGFLYFVEDAQRVRRLRLPPEGAGPSADEPQMVYESGAPFKASAIAVVPESNSHSVVWSEQGNETIRALRCPNP